uniref:Uncharacterized protein n=1 Tax=Helianthus annuus TaxID=4232 RepID=A0A251UZP5_HELAN
MCIRNMIIYYHSIPKKQTLPSPSLLRSVVSPSHSKQILPVLDVLRIPSLGTN